MGTTKNGQVSDHLNTESTSDTSKKASLDQIESERELDDFGLPKNKPRRPIPEQSESDEDEEGAIFHDAKDDIPMVRGNSTSQSPTSGSNRSSLGKKDSPRQIPVNDDQNIGPTVPSTSPASICEERGADVQAEKPVQALQNDRRTCSDLKNLATTESRPSTPSSLGKAQNDEAKSPESSPQDKKDMTPSNKTKRTIAAPAVSEWSHQRLAPQHEEVKEEEDEEVWQAMPAIAQYDLYNDDGKLLARGAEPEKDEEAAYEGLGGAGKGYTRVQLDEDAKSATSMDEDTSYLFKESRVYNVLDDEEQRDASSQLQATKDLLTEGQRIAYVGVARLAMYNMTKELEDIESTRATKKDLSKALESMTKWGQQMMVRLYAHMEIDSAEQLMIEQLADHGVQPTDLVPPLMQNSRVANPLTSLGSPRRSSPTRKQEAGQSSSGSASLGTAGPVALPLKDGDEEDVPRVHTPSQMEQTAKIDLDLRWTVLCDLFLLLISDAIYDSRSRRLLEQVAKAMDISWTQICRFEKRVIDALEMQEEANKENWNEDEHMENRRKMGLKRKYMVMGLATVGGGLVIGLSAGLLAPVIGAGLAAGFTTIGVTGTAGFLGGVGGAALITSAATAAGGTIAVRASHRRTGAVKTF